MPELRRILQVEDDPDIQAVVKSNAVPPWSMAMALGRSGPGTIRARMAVDRDQKPPIETPIRARPSMNTR